MQLIQCREMGSRRCGSDGFGAVYPYPREEGDAAGIPIAQLFS